MPVPPERQKQYNREYYQTHIKQIRLERLNKAKEFLGGKCSECESSEDLIFHHIDSTTKLFEISPGASKSFNKFWEEVNKCVLLCQSCHKKEHEMRHGTIAMYSNNKCRCESCRKAESIYRQNLRIIGGPAGEGWR